MKIQSIKEIRELSKQVTQEDGSTKTIYPGDLTGYLVNGSINVPLDSNNRLYKQIQKWMANGGSIEPAYTEEEIFELVKKQKLSEINQAFNNEIKSISSKYPDAEKLSWTKQEQESRAYLNDNSVSTPLIDKIVEARGIDKDELVNRIIEKADAYMSLAGQAIGKRQRLEDLVEQANTIEDLESIKW